MKLADIPAPVWQLATSVLGGLLVLWLWNRYVKEAAAKAAAAVNPLNHDNIFAASVNAAGAAIAGDEEFSLGAGLYNLVHRDEFEESERRHREALGKE